MIQVSVIVPVYNVEKYIDKCIKTLLEQPIEDIEFIIINDGSTDSTLEKINKYLPNEKIKLFNRTNHGIGNTRNFGLEQAKGEYIGFVDSDDFVEKTMFKEMYDRAKEANLDIVVCDFYEENEEKKNSIVKNITNLNNDISNFRKMPSLLNSINLSPWNKLYKRELIEQKKLRFVEDLKYEDVPFVVNALDSAKEIGKLNKPLYHYVVHSKSETTIVDKKSFDIFKIFDMLISAHGQKDYLKEELKYLIVQRLSDYNIQQRNQKDKKIREKFIDTSFKYLSGNFPNYKQNKYYKDLSFAKRIIVKNKSIAKLYCNLYGALKQKGSQKEQIN